MAGFGRYSLKRKELHKLTSSEGNGGSAERDGSIEFSVSLPAEVTDCFLSVLCDDTGEVKNFPVDGGRIILSCDVLCDGRDDGLFFYKFAVNTPQGSYEIVRGEDGISDTLRDRREGFDGAFALTVFRKRKNPPAWLYGGIIYHIFVDRFFRGGNEPCRADAVMNEDWYNGIPPYVKKSGDRLDNNVFFGGDLYGVIEKLPYISSLGVTCIYLSPIFEAYSNHKYDTGNYDKVDDMFGGEGAFSVLVSECKNYGITLILDGVFNHTGDDSIYFNRTGKYGDGGAYRDKNSPYYEWYNFTDYPEKYESWWGIDVLPRVKSDTPSYKAYLFGENGVIRRRLREGVGGFRLDVADELSDEFLSELKSAALTERDDCVIIGEVWENAAEKVSYGRRRRYLRGKELDSVMNYPIRTAIISYLRDGDCETFLKNTAEVYGEYPDFAQSALMNIIGTHDTIRIITALAGESPEGKSQDERAVYKMTETQYSKGIGLVKAAYLISNMLPGVPCIYYGDEIGMQGYSDPFNRRPYPWGREDEDLLGFYRRIGGIRKNENALFCGKMRIVYVDRDILCIERTAGGELLCGIINRSSDEYVYSSEFTSEEMISGFEGKKIVINPHGCALIKTKNDRNEYGVYRAL